MAHARRSLQKRSRPDAARTHPHRDRRLREDPIPTAHAACCRRPCYDRISRARSFASAARPVGLRQDDIAAPARRPRKAADPGSRIVRFGDQDVTARPVEKRGVGMVFQSYALFPQMTVAANIGYGLKVRGVDEAPERSACRRRTGRPRAPGLNGLEGKRPRGRAVGRPAPAGRARPRGRGAASRAAARRAARRARQREAEGVDCATSSRRAAAPARHHRGSRHARSV